MKSQSTGFCITHRSSQSKSQQISIYYRHINAANPASSNTTILYLPGLCSNWSGRKGVALENLALKNNFNYLTLHYQGHGGDTINSTRSSGNVEDIVSLQEWIDDILSVIDDSCSKVEDSKYIIVGSSIGCWLGMHVAIKLGSRVTGMICIAPAIDIFRQYIDSLDSDKDIVEIPSLWVESGCIRLKKSLLTDACDRFLLLSDANDEIIQNRLHPMRIAILHGDMDDVISVPQVERMASILSMNNSKIELKIIKGGDHRLSREEDLVLLANTVDSFFL